MNAKLKFKEGWIMLKQPFKFAELKNPLQKMTILYGYSEKPIIERTVNSEGRLLIAKINNISSNLFASGGDFKYIKRYGESKEDFKERMNAEYDYVIKHFSTKEIYKGELIQCFIGSVACKFYPEEYTIIDKETFDFVLTSEDYFMKIDDDSYFNNIEIKNRIHYVQSRGVDIDTAKRFSSGSAKDSVYFKPSLGVLNMFCRSYEIYSPDTDYNKKDLNYLKSIA